MSWIVITVIIVYLVVLAWAALDAFENTNLGCMWLLLFITTPFLSLVIYLIFRAYAMRRVDVVDSSDPREYGGPLRHFGSEIEKAKFLEAVSHGQGTMYEPARRSGAPAGFRHFSDTHAETLIEQGLHGEAFDYLAELYELARQDRDGRAQDTYLHYIHRLPGGARLLAAWEKERRIAGDERDGSDSAPPKREVPF